MFGSDAYNVLAAQLRTALAGITPVPMVNLGWPTERLLLDNIAKSDSTIVSLFDLATSRDTSRFMVFAANEIVVPTGITSLLSQTPLAASVTVTLGGTVVANDAVSFVAQNGKILQAAVAIASATDTPSTMAAQLAANINANPVLSTWVGASAFDAVVTVENKIAVAMPVGSNVGNLGSRWVEQGRHARSGQANVWAGTAAQRDAVARLVDEKLAYLDAHFGAQGGSGTDGTWVRIRHLGDRMIDDDVYRDLYRWMFHVELEYGTTYEETVYSVLAFIPQVYVNLPTGGQLPL